VVGNWIASKWVFRDAKKYRAIFDVPKQKNVGKYLKKLGPQRAGKRCLSRVVLCIIYCSQSSKEIS
jgi:hypothetical protein|tara:strand:+ start:118 stop:315 length:198 start_codon:yes stop_codon:yes gene_type:complete